MVSTMAFFKGNSVSNCVLAASSSCRPNKLGGQVAMPLGTRNRESRADVNEKSGLLETMMGSERVGAERAKNVESGNGASIDPTQHEGGKKRRKNIPVGTNHGKRRAVRGQRASSSNTRDQTSTNAEASHPRLGNCLALAQGANSPLQPWRRSRKKKAECPKKGRGETTFMGNFGGGAGWDPTESGMRGTVDSGGHRVEGKVGRRVKEARHTGSKRRSA